jgi:hypothetical protein
VDLELVDIAGRIVLSQRIAGSGAPVALATAGLSAGEYVLHLRHSDGGKALRVVLR